MRRAGRRVGRHAGLVAAAAARAPAAAAGVRRASRRPLRVRRRPRRAGARDRPARGDRARARDRRQPGTCWTTGDYDGLLVAVWAFLAGSLYGGFGYWRSARSSTAACRLLGSQGSFRRSRHVLAFAAVPIALSLVLWPVKLARLRRGCVPERRPRRGRRRRRVRRPRLAFLALGGRAARDRRARGARLDVGPLARGLRTRPRRAGRARARCSATPERCLERCELLVGDARTCACSSGNAPLRTSAAYCATASPISSAISA